MAKTIRTLLVALLNATLMLGALCLVLALMVVNRADAITARFAESLDRTAPLATELRALRDEVSGLRSDLDAVRTESAGLSPEAGARLDSAVAHMTARLDGLTTDVSALRDLPFTLTDHAISAAGAEAARRANALRGCVVPDAQG